VSFLFALALVARAATQQGVDLPDHPWDVTHLDLDLSLDLDAGHVTGRATLDATRLGAPSPVLTLHQRHLRIDEVLVDGKPAPYRARLDRLDIEVPVDRPSVQVAIRYETEPLAGLHFRGLADAPKGEAKVVWSQGEAEQHRYWFPSWDHPSDRFTVATHLTVDGDHTAYAIGTLQEKTPLNNGRVRWSYRLDEPVVNYLVAIMAGDVVEAPLPGEASAPLTLLVPRGQSIEAAIRATAPTAQMFGYFEGVLDEPFPYPTYRQVFAPRYLHGGMENPGFVVLADDLQLHSDDEDPRRAHRVVAHELAHQWFGDLLTCLGWTELWLNEGFATYWAGRWEADRDGEAWLAWRTHSWHRGALRDARPVAPNATTFQGADNAGVYVQGASVLRMLEVHLGRETFDTVVRTWIDRHRGQLVTSDQLRRVIRDVSGRDVGPWFDLYIHGAGHPSLSSTWSWDAEAKQLRLVIEQPEADDTPMARLPLHVSIATAEGPLDAQLTVGPGRTELVRTLSEAPLHVAVDPVGGLLAHWERTQSAAQWAHQAEHGATPYARLTAMAALHETAEPEALEALVAIVGDRKEHDALRMSAARALATMPTEGAVAALLDARDGASTTLRAELYEALKTLGDRVDAEPLLRALRKGSPEERLEALDALGKVAPDRAAAVSRRWLAARDPHPEGHAHAVALSTLAQVADPDDARLALPFLRSDAQPWPQSQARALLGATLPELDDDDPVRSIALRRITSHLASRDLRTQQRAIAFLGKHGDADAAHDLTDWAAGRRWDTLSDDARNAAKLIRTRTAPEPVADDDVQALKDELEALRKRVEDLERF
jgi:aminopeptidase N